MKAVILDGAAANDTTGVQVRETLVSQLKERGWSAVEIMLRDRKIGPCGGCFHCWVRTPGICILDDDNRSISEQVMSSDLLVYLTPVTFGGYTSVLKGMVDHLIPNISPYLQAIDGETHHKKRYKNYPDMMTISWMDGPDPRAEAVFRYLTLRNAINFFCPEQYCGVLTERPSSEQTETSIRKWLNDMENGMASQPVTAAEIDRSLGPIGGNNATPPERALLLVGSPKQQKSTSHVIGQYFNQQLESSGIKTETVFLYKEVRSPETMDALLERIDTSDIVTLVCPLYVDALPAPVTGVLEKIRDRRQTSRVSGKPMFCAISNCGFLEAIHPKSALAICTLFAQQAGLSWGGSLAIGGSGMLSGKPLAEDGGRTARIRSAIETAADALARGSGIPAEAQELLDKPIMPGWLYRYFSGFGWRSMAKKHGMLKELNRTPYAP